MTASLSQPLLQAVQNDMFAPPSTTLTVLSFGAGQDSTALLEMYIQDEAGFRARYAPGRFLVVMSDTSDEHPHTVEHVKAVRARCATLGIPFVLIDPSMGYHSPSWLGLRHFYRTKTAIGSKSYPSTCSHKLKIEPIYRFLEVYLAEQYGVRQGKKLGYYEFAARFGKLRVILGIAKGEEGRRAKPQANPVWFRENIEVVYPLIDYGMDRAACQAYIASKGQPVPPPSNCVLCHWLSLQELEWLRRNLPADLEDWCQLEEAKLTKYAHLNRVPVVRLDANGNEVTKIVNKNLGVFGTRTLREKMVEAQEKYGHWTNAELDAYKFSHGACGSKF